MAKAAFRLSLLVTVAIGIGIALVYRDVFSAQVLENWVSRFGQAGPLVFIGLYAVATVLFLPGSIITLVGGALFGPLWGAALGDAPGWDRTTAARLFRPPLYQTELPKRGCEGDAATSR